MSVRYATISAMRAAATSGFNAGVANTCFVDTVGDFFQFRAGSTATAVSNVVVTSSDALGQWFRMGIPNQAFTSAAYFSVDPSGGRGSDENAGWGTTQAQADARPLASFHELNRRLVGRADVALFIHVMSASDSTNFTVLTNLGVNGGTLQYVTIFGSLIPVDGAATRTIATSTVAVPSSNTERTIAITGLGLAPQYVGMLVMNAAGTKTAVVTRQPSSGVLAISQPRSCDPFAGDVGSVTDFSNAEVVTFYDCTTIPDYPLPANYPKYPVVARLRIDLGSSGVFPSGQLGGSQPGFMQCIFGSDGIAACTLASSRSLNQDTAPFVTCCALRARRVNFGGTWNFQSVAVCLSGSGTNTGFGPRFSDATIFIQDELSMTSGGTLTADGGDVSFLPMGGAQIATFGLTNTAISTGLAGVTHVVRGAVFYCSNLLVWYGTNPAIIAGSGGDGLLALSPGLHRLPYDATKLTVTVGGTGNRVAVTTYSGATAALDFKDVPISTQDGVFLAGDASAINRGKVVLSHAGAPSISYGDQSPASDSVALTWAVGDRRIAVGGAAGAIAYWRCSVAGTPGTWVTFP